MFLNLRRIFIVHKWFALINVPCVTKKNLYLAITSWYLHKYQLGEVFNRVFKSISFQMFLILLRDECWNLRIYLGIFIFNLSFLMFLLWNKIWLIIIWPLQPAVGFMACTYLSHSIFMSYCALHMCYRNCTSYWVSCQPVC